MIEVNLNIELIEVTAPHEKVRPQILNNLRDSYQNDKKPNDIHVEVVVLGVVLYNAGKRLKIENDHDTVHGEKPAGKSCYLRVPQLRHLFRIIFVYTNLCD